MTRWRWRPTRSAREPGTCRVSSPRRSGGSTFTGDAGPAYRAGVVDAGPGPEAIRHVPHCAPGLARSLAAELGQGDVVLIKA